MLGPPSVPPAPLLQLLPLAQRGPRCAQAPVLRGPLPATPLDGSLGLGLRWPWVWTRAMSQPMGVGASASYPNMRVLLSLYHEILGRSNEGT